MIECVKTDIKREYVAIDIAKMVAALFVAAIHITPLKETSTEVFFWFNQIIFRLAVPFFFLVSGFFVGRKLNDKKMVFRYTGRIVNMYMLYTIIYMPQIIYDFIKSDKGIERWGVEILYKFFFEGSYTQFWYFLALIFAIWFLYFGKKLDMSDRCILGVALVLYCLGVVKAVYSSDVSHLEWANGLFERMNVLFPIVENGAFKAFPFVVLGYYVCNNLKIYNTKKIMCLFIVSFACMHIEAFRSIHKIGYEGQEFLLATLPTIYYLFLLIYSSKIDHKYIPIGKMFRNLSTLIFGFHLFVRFYAHVIFVKILKWNLNSVKYYLLMVMCTVFFSIIILKLSNRPRLSWLKKLY